MTVSATRENGLIRSQAEGVAERVNSQLLEAAAAPIIKRKQSFQEPVTEAGTRSRHGVQFMKKYGYIVWNNGICRALGNRFVSCMTTEVTADAVFRTKAAAASATKLARGPKRKSDQWVHDPWADAVIIPLRRCTDCSGLTFELPSYRLRKCYRCRVGCQRYGTSQKGHDRYWRYNHNQKGLARNRRYLDTKVEERSLLRNDPGAMAMSWKRLRLEGRSRQQALTTIVNRPHPPAGTAEYQRRWQLEQKRKQRQSAA